MPHFSTDPLHGKTLKMILEYLVERYGFEQLGKEVAIKCFTSNPSISSSLVFLRKTPWARAKVEWLYLSSVQYPDREDIQGPPSDLKL